MVKLSEQFRDAAVRLKGPDRLDDEISRQEDVRLIYEPLQALLTPFVDLTECDVLDFGCGTGASSVVLARLGARSVLGIDVWREALDVARLRARDCGVETVASFRHETDTLHCDLKSESFDVAVLNAVLEHVPPSSRVDLMREVWRLVRPGGYLCISETPNAFWPVESHTTKLAGTPYLPVRVALWYAKLRNRIPRDQTVERALERGFRGVTLRQIVGGLPPSDVRICNDYGQYDSIASYFVNPKRRWQFRLVTAPLRLRGIRPAALLPTWRLMLQKLAQ